MNTITAPQVEQLKERAKALKLYGLIDQWEELMESDYEWINRLIHWEETQRHYRSLERRPVVTLCFFPVYKSVYPFIV